MLNLNSIFLRRFDFADPLIEKAVLLGGHKTKKAAITAALEEYVRRREQLKIFELFGKIDYEDGYPEAARGKHKHQITESSS